MKWLKPAPISWLSFAGVFFGVHLIWVVIQIVFFGARGKSTHWADFAIFGIGVGLFFTIFTCFGFALATSPLPKISRISKRAEVSCAVVAASASYVFLAAGYLERAQRYLHKVGVPALSEDGVPILSLVLLGIVSGIVVLSVMKLRASLVRAGPRPSF